MLTMYVISKVNEFFNNIFNEYGLTIQPDFEFNPDLSITPELRTKFTSSNQNTSWLSIVFNRSQISISRNNTNRLYSAIDSRTLLSNKIKKYDAKQVETDITYVIYSNDYSKLEAFEELCTLYLNNSVKLHISYSNNISNDENYKERNYIIGIYNISIGDISLVDYETSGGLYSLQFKFTIDYTLDILFKLNKSLLAIILRFGFGNCIGNSKKFEPIYELKLTEDDINDLNSKINKD